MTLDPKRYFETNFLASPNSKAKPYIALSKFVGSGISSFAFELIQVMVANPLWPTDEVAGNRQKFRQPSPEELVTRALSISEIAYEKMLNAGWIHEMPGIDEMYEDNGQVGFMPHKKGGGQAQG